MHLMLDGIFLKTANTTNWYIGKIVLLKVQSNNKCKDEF